MQSLSFSIEAHKQSQQNQAALEDLRLQRLNADILLSEQEPLFGMQTAVSLLTLLQKPITYNKPVCMQISGTGVRQPVFACDTDISAAINQICWVLSGKTPNHTIWVDSELSDTAVTLHLWNNHITLKTSSVDQFHQLSTAQTLLQFTNVTGAILPLATAHRLIIKNGGQLKISNQSPTKIKITLPRL